MSHPKVRNLGSSSILVLWQICSNMQIVTNCHAKKTVFFSTFTLYNPLNLLIIPYKMYVNWRFGPPITFWSFTEWNRGVRHWFDGQINWNWSWSAWSWICPTYCTVFSILYLLYCTYSTCLYSVYGSTVNVAWYNILVFPKAKQGAKYAYFEPNFERP